MKVKIYAYPTSDGQRVPLWEAQRLAAENGETESDGWTEYTPGPDTHTTDLELIAQALRWASEGQAVRIEIN